MMYLERDRKRQEETAREDRQLCTERGGRRADRARD